MNSQPSLSSTSDAQKANGFPFAFRVSDLKPLNSDSAPVCTGLRQTRRDSRPNSWGGWPASRQAGRLKRRHSRDSLRRRSLVVNPTCPKREKPTSDTDSSDSQGICWRWTECTAEAGRGCPAPNRTMRWSTDRMKIRLTARGFHRFDKYRTRILLFCGKLNQYPS